MAGAFPVWRAVLRDDVWRLNEHGDRGDGRHVRRFQLFICLPVRGAFREIFEQIAFFQFVIDGGKVRNHVEMREQAEALDEEDALRDNAFFTDKAVPSAF